MIRRIKIYFIRKLSYLESFLPIIISAGPYISAVLLILKFLHEELGSVNRVNYKKVEMRVDNLVERMLEDGYFCEFTWPIENYS